MEGVQNLTAYMYSTCVQKICIVDENEEEEIIVVYMKLFNSIGREFIFEENFPSVASKSLAFCHNCLSFSLRVNGLRNPWLPNDHTLFFFFPISSLIFIFVVSFSEVRAIPHKPISSCLYQFVQNCKITQVFAVCGNPCTWTWGSMQLMDTKTLLWPMFQVDERRILSRTHKSAGQLTFH